MLRRSSSPPRSAITAVRGGRVARAFVFLAIGLILAGDARVLGALGGKRPLRPPGVERVVAVRLAALEKVLSPWVTPNPLPSPGPKPPASAISQARLTPSAAARPSTSPRPAPPLPAPTATSMAAPPPPPPVDPLKAYRGLGAWVDWYDYGQPDSIDPAVIVDQLAQHGVRTLFFETGLWAKPRDILDPGVVNVFLDHAHARGIQVVGWYLPGFADIDRDIRASAAVLTYATPTGQHFDGFAPDIEDRSAIEQAGRRTVTVSAPASRTCRRPCTYTVVTDLPAPEVLSRFNGGVAEYSRRLRELVGGATLGAIVPDAKNNRRAPEYWAGFPWPQIAARYDVVLPMAYWSVVKPAGCPAQDAGSYIREAVGATQALMGTPKPIHPIGGIADCLRARDVSSYVDATKGLGSTGGSLYDFLTTQANPEQGTFWQLLARLNG